MDFIVHVAQIIIPYRKLNANVKRCIFRKPLHTVEFTRINQQYYLIFETKTGKCFQIFKKCSSLLFLSTFSKGDLLAQAELSKSKKQEVGSSNRKTFLIE